MSEDADEIRRKRVERLRLIQEQEQLRRANEPKPDPTPDPPAVVNKDPAKRIESPVPKPAAPAPKIQKAEPSRKIDNTPTISIEEWKENTAVEVLRTSLIQASDQNVYLESLAEELQSDGETLMVSEQLDKVLFSKLTEHRCLPSSFDYLWTSWNRAVGLSRVLSTNDAQLTLKRQFLAKIQDLLLSYVITVTSTPDMFLGASTTERLLAKANGQSPPWDFLTAALNKATEDERLDEFLGPIIKETGDNLLQVQWHGDYKPHLVLLEVITSHKASAAAITALEGFQVSDDINANSDSSANSPFAISNTTLLGPFLSLSPLMLETPLKNFPNAEILADTRLRQIEMDIMTEWIVVSKRLFAIFNKIVRSGAEARIRLLQYFGKIIDLNHKRKGMQVDQLKVTPDGMMFNIFWLLLKFSEPFVEPSGSKLDKISYEYYKQTGCLVDISEETKVNAELKESEEYYAERINVEPNFISHCFFLTSAYLNYAWGGIIDKLDNMNRTIKDLRGVMQRIDGELEKWRGTPMEQQVTATQKKVVTRLRFMIGFTHTVNALVYDHEVTTTIAQFTCFQFMFLSSAADTEHRYPFKQVTLPYEKEPEYFKHYPEYLLEAPVDTLLHSLKYNPRPVYATHQIQSSHLTTYMLTILRNTEFVRNPYVKSKLVEAMFLGTLTGQDRRNSWLVQVFDTDKLCLDNLLHSLMNWYIECEQTGFYDKHNTRHYLANLIIAIWPNSIYKRKLEQEAKNSADFFVQFVALLLNDATYLLDESLTKLQEIHTLQNELGAEPPVIGGPEESQETQEKRQRLAAAEKHCQSLMGLTNKTIDLFVLFTRAIPRAFVSVEIVDRLAAMLNYNLVALVGPKCRELKVRDPEKYSFRPRELLSAICDVYLNLAQEEAFIKGVARDGRSYDHEQFARASTILGRHGLKTTENLNKFMKVADEAEAIKNADEEGELELGEIPDEFLDPLMYTLMENPVILPSSRVTIDYGTIKSHLLSDPKDPFNRAPLKIEDCKPDEEMKQKIEQFKRQRKEEANKNKMEVDS